MNKVLKKVGLSAVVATFVFGLASTSSALVPQSPDTETAEFTSYTATVVDGDFGATYNDNENYTLVLDNTSRKANGGNGKSRIKYSKSYTGLSGNMNVVSSFETAGDAASAQKPNVKVYNQIAFDGGVVAAQGQPAGSFTGDESLSYERCQPAVDNVSKTFCGTVGKSVPKAEGIISMGSNFVAQQANVVTDGKIENVASSGAQFGAFPGMSYKINVAGVDGSAGLAAASAAANMNVNIKEIAADNTTTTTTAYTRNTKANGFINFSQDMNYQSKIK